MDWVSGAQRETFQRWVEHTGNVVYWTNRDVMDSSAEACFLALKLKPVSIEHTVNCEVVGASFEHREEGHDAFILKLCFTILEKPRGQRARKKSKNKLQYEQRKPRASKQSSLECGNTHSGLVGSDVPLEAVIDIQATPMKILTCSPALVFDSSSLTVDDIVATTYVEGFTAWLRDQVKSILALREHSSCSEERYPLKLELSRQKRFYCQIDKSFTHDYCVEGSTELPVKVYFHLKTPVLMTSSSSSSASSILFPAPKTYGHLRL